MSWISEHHGAARWTALILIAIGMLLLGWEAYVLANTDSKDTITHVTRQFNRKLGGLIALATLGLWWHFFGWIPASWR